MSDDQIFSIFLLVDLEQVDWVLSAIWWLQDWWPGKPQPRLADKHQLSNQHLPDFLVLGNFSKQNKGYLLLKLFQGIG